MNKLCVKCVHYHHVETVVKGQSWERCRHPEVINPVKGEDASCYVARRAKGVCGREGRLHEAQPDMLLLMKSEPIRSWLSSRLVFAEPGAADSSHATC